MGGRHAGPTTLRMTRVAWAVLAPLAAATLLGLVVLWPSGTSDPAPAASAREIDGTVLAVDEQDCSSSQGAPPTSCGSVTVLLEEDGTEREQEVPLSTSPGAPDVEVGDAVVIASAQGADGDIYGVVDHQRGTELWVVAGIFSLALIAFGRWRGVSALVGLGLTFVVLFVFVVPAIVSGQPPVPVAVVGASTVTLVVLYLTHGVSPPTTVAVMGTMASLVLTGVLSELAVRALHLTGVTDDISTAVATTHGIDVRGLLVASIIIGSVGVLDDVTVTQAATVDELALANPGYGPAELFRAASRVGRSHIASVVNTIVLAYAGSSLPLLVLVVADNGSFSQVATTQLISQEIVRSAVATLGLIAAVPLTTGLAALATHRSATSPQPA